MPVEQLFTQRNCYRDPLTLYMAARDVKRMPGVFSAFCAGGGEQNARYARALGFRHTDIQDLAEGDIFGVVRCANDETACAAIDALRRAALTEPLLWDRYSPSTLDGALAVNKKLNLALVSNASERAAEIVRDCLLRSLNVMAFTDTLSLEQEIELKQLAEKKGLLLMGPGCHSAVIGGVPLGFASEVRAGSVGALSATGPALQKFCCHVDALGCGISAALGCGPRDLEESVGGVTAKRALAALCADEHTNAVALLLRTHERAVALELLELAKKSKKFIAVYAPPLTQAEIESAGCAFARSIAECATLCASAVKKQDKPTGESTFFENDAALVVSRERIGKSAEARFIRGFFTASDICYEVGAALAPQLDPLWSNTPVRPLDKLADPLVSVDNCLIDFRDDVFTMNGRLGPLLEPAARDLRFLTDAHDPTLSVAVVDCVLGYGCYERSTSELCDAVVKAKTAAAESGNNLSVIAVLCGAEKDPLPRSSAKQMLLGAGAVVTSSAAEAANIALGIAGKGDPA